MAAIWPPALAGESWSQAIKVQLVTWLRDDPILVPLIAGRVYTVTPPNVVFPFVRIEGFAPRPTNTFRNAKRAVRIQAKALSQATHEEEIDRIGDRIAAIVEGQRTAPLGAFRSADWSIDRIETPPTYEEAEPGNVVTRQRPVIVLVQLTP